jgi:hypothetical protein
MFREVSQGLAGALTILPFLAISLFTFLPEKPPLELRQGLLALIAWLAITAASWAAYFKARREVRSDLFG